MKDVLRKGNEKEKAYQVRWESIVGLGEQQFGFTKEWSLTIGNIKGEKIGGFLILENFECHTHV